MSTFTPSVKKFLVWDGETLHGPTDILEAHRYLLPPAYILDSGKISVEDAAKAWGRLGSTLSQQQKPDVSLVRAPTFLAFTGLHDAAGREVYEGHIVERVNGSRPLLVLYGHYIEPDNGYDDHGVFLDTGDSEYGCPVHGDMTTWRIVGHV